MAVKSLAAKGVVWKGSHAILMARIVDIDNILVNQGGVTGITCQVTQMDNPTNFTQPSVVVASAVFNALQTDAKWTKDDLGYNFLFEITPDDIPLGEKTYRVEFTVTDINTKISHIVYEITTAPLFKS